MASPNGCLLWTGAKSHSGHGQVYVDGKLDRTHRVAWTLAKGSIPEGLCVLHRCDTPACVKVDHLFLGTQSENMQDMMQKGRGAKGSRTGSAKIDEATALKIRNDPRPLSVLSAEYGLSIGTLSALRNGKTWKHVDRAAPVQEAA